MSETVNDAKAAARALRLLAQDADDLQVVSAALQDAIAHVGDIKYEPAARRLTVLFNRFRWEKADDCGCERVYSALQFGDVCGVRHKGLQSEDKGALVSCLALDFEPADEPPGGAVLLRFSHGGDLRVEVECVDGVLADVSEPWLARCAPAHDSDPAAETPGRDAGPGHGRVSG